MIEVTMLKRREARLRLRQWKGTSMSESKKPRVAAIIDLLKASGVKDQHLEELQTKVDSLIDDGIHFHWHGDTGGDGVPDTFIDIDTVT
jgi:hypothetical protein